MDDGFAEANQGSIGKAIAAIVKGRPSGEAAISANFPLRARIVLGEGAPIIQQQGGLPIFRMGVLKGLVASAAPSTTSKMMIAHGPGWRRLMPICSSGVKIPSDTADGSWLAWAHEAGDLNDMWAVLGNAVTMNAIPDGTLPFPDGTIIARLAWKDMPSDESNAVFGRFQSFVPEPAHECSVHGLGYKKVRQHWRDTPSSGPLHGPSTGKRSV
jgi:hypothetical protein